MKGSDMMGSEAIGAAGNYGRKLWKDDNYRGGRKAT